MKIRILLLALLISTPAFAQTKLSDYLYSFVPSTTMNVTLCVAANQCSAPLEVQAGAYTNCGYPFGAQPYTLPGTNIGCWGTPLNATYTLIVNSSGSLGGSVEVDGVTATLNSLTFVTQFGPFATLAACQAYMTNAASYLSGGATFNAEAGAPVPVQVAITNSQCSEQ